MQRQRIYRKLKPFAAAVVFALIGFIYSMSAADGDISSSLSFRVAKKIITLAQNVLEANWSDGAVLHMAMSIHFLVRKCAHVTEYVLLSIFTTIFLRAYGQMQVKRYLTAAIFCVLVAISDEVHQLFVPNREGSVRDVLIDTLGVIIGIALIVVVRKILRRNKAEQG